MTLPFGLTNEELPRLASFVMGTDAIVIVILLAFACLPASVESNTAYNYVENKDVPINSNNVGFLAWGSAARIDGGYVVTVDRDIPPVMKNIIVKHENCHVQQYKRKANMMSEEREIECYIRMWLP